MLTDSQWEALRQVNIETVDKSELVDIRSVRVDPNAPYEQRMREFLEQIKNPYAFRVGDTAVKIEFAPDGIPLRDAMMSYLKTLRAGQ